MSLLAAALVVFRGRVALPRPERCHAAIAAISLGLIAPAYVQADVAEIFERVSPAVVVVDAVSSSNQVTAFGSGFIVRPDGVVVTNYHVIEDAARVDIRLVSGQTFRSVRVLYKDQGRDLAVLFANAKGLPVVPMGDSDRMRIGEELIAIGNPEGFQNTVTRGIASGRRKLHGMEYIQTDAPLSHGSSGGPLLNTRGEVIGVTALIWSDVRNIGFAIPVNDAKRALQHVAAEEDREAGQRARADRLWQTIRTAMQASAYARARPGLEEFLRDFPDDQRAPDAWLRLGLTRLNLGELKSALEAFRTAHDREPPPSRSQEVKLWEAETLFRLRRYEEAEAAYAVIAWADTESPLTPHATYGLALTERELHRTELAVRVLQQFLDRWPGHRSAPQATLHLAHLLADLKRYEEVIPLVSDFRTKHPDHPDADAQYLLGWAQLETGRTRDGVATLRAFLSANPADKRAPTVRQKITETVKGTLG